MLRASFDEGVDYSHLFKHLTKATLFILLVYATYKKHTKSKKLEQPKIIEEVSLFFHLKDAKTYQEKPKDVSVFEQGFFKKLPVSQIEKEHKFQWKEDVFATYEPDDDKYIYSRIIDSQSVPTWSSTLGNPMVAQLQFYLNHIDEFNEKVALKYFGADLEWGVVAKEYFNVCDSIISFYASKIKPNYYDDLPKFYTMCINIGDRECITDAYKFGNMSRFIMHLPNENDIIDLPDEIKKIVATANCRLDFVNICNNQIPVLIQKKPINTNEVVGFHYGRSYWGLRKPFWLVDKKGNKIVKAEYDDFNKLALSRR